MIEFSLPFHILQLVKSIPFHIPQAWKRCPFWAEPPAIGFYREYHIPPPPPSFTPHLCILKKFRWVTGIVSKQIWWRSKGLSFIFFISRSQICATNKIIGICRPNSFENPVLENNASEGFIFTKQHFRCALRLFWFVTQSLEDEYWESGDIIHVQWHNAGPVS